MDESAMLEIYLNDHLAGATGGTELLKRTAAAHQSEPLGAELTLLAREVEQDLGTLKEIMADLDVSAQHTKQAVGWLAEKAGRLKPNGHLTSRSPLSDVLELELMRLGVEGKASCWRTLRALADTDPRIGADRVENLLGRAARQADRLEALRTETAARVFTPEGRQSQERR